MPKSFQLSGGDADPADRGAEAGGAATPGDTPDETDPADQAPEPPDPNRGWPTPELAETAVWPRLTAETDAEESPYSPYAPLRATNIPELASRLRMSLSMLVRRLRQVELPDDMGISTETLTLAEASALARLDRLGSATTASLARMEQISPQSMSAILARLRQRGYVATEPDEYDRRRKLVELTEEGYRVVRARRESYSTKLTRALSSEFSVDEIAQLEAAVPLLQRLADRL